MWNQGDQLGERWWLHSGGGGSRCDKKLWNTASILGVGLKILADGLWSVILQKRNQE